MSRHIYANLAPIGWVNLSSDSETVISNNYTSPNIWWSEGGTLDSIELTSVPDKLKDYPFVKVTYKGSDYRVSPFDFQIVNTAD